MMFCDSGCMEGMRFLDLKTTRWILIDEVHEMIELTASCRSLWALLWLDGCTEILWSSAKRHCVRINLTHIVMSFNGY